MKFYLEKYVYEYNIIKKIASNNILSLGLAIFGIGLSIFSVIFAIYVRA